MTVGFTAAFQVLFVRINLGINLGYFLTILAVTVFGTAAFGGTSRNYFSGMVIVALYIKTVFLSTAFLV